MKAVEEKVFPTVDAPAGTPSAEGRRRLMSERWEPLFLADWDRVVFLHFEVDAEKLAGHVPFELDLDADGRAFVSLVAFTMRDMRLSRGGKATRWLTRPIATHPFLNVRTYVRHQGEPGIHFLCEWMNNRLAAQLGPWVFGLPYRLGGLHYDHRGEEGVVAGRVEGHLLALNYRGRTMKDEPAIPCGADTTDEFLSERYTAFTRHRWFDGFFRIWHPPWPLMQVEVDELDAGLLLEAPGGDEWGKTARFHSAHFSPGARDVWMGRPHILERN